MPVRTALSRRLLMRMRSSGSSVCLHQLVPVLWVGGRDPSPVEVAAPSPAVGLGSELSLKLHQAPAAGAGAEVGLDLGRGLAEAGQVDAEQLGAPVQRRRDRPSQARVVPCPHRPRISNRGSRPRPPSCVPRQEPRTACWAAAKTGTADPSLVAIAATVYCPDAYI